MGSNNAIAQLSAKELVALVNRNQGPELFFQQPFTPLTQPIIPQNISLNRPMERITITWSGRIVVGVNPLTPFPESMHNLLERVRLQGKHSIFGAQVPIDITGGTLGRMGRLFRDAISQAGILQAGQFVWSGDSADTQTASSAFNGSVGNHDAIVVWEIPLTPIVKAAMKAVTTPYLYMAKNWGDTLQLQLFFGAGQSLGVFGAGTTVAFETFGGGGGTQPLVTISTNYEILGPLEPNVVPAVVVRSENPVSGVVTAAAANVRLVNLQKQKTSSIVLKSGTIPVGLPAGVSAFGTLVDTLLARTRIVADNKPVRDNFDNQHQRAYAASAYEVTPQSGYLHFPFIEGQNPPTVLRGDLLSQGALFQVISDIVSAGATQSVNVMQEMVLGDPDVVGA